MIEFFNLPRAVVYLIAVTLTISTFAQTVAVVMSYYRYPRTRKRVIETLLEVILLGQIILCSLLHMQAENEFESGVLVAPQYTALRIVVFVAIVLLVISALVLTRRVRLLPIIIAAGLTLSLVEHITGYAFVYVNMAVIAFLLVRGFVKGISYYGENKTGLSALSVKSAIDSMITGVMFCQQDGFILLVNEQMQQLMKAITGKTQRNGKQFFSLLSLGELQPGCHVFWFEGQNVCLLPDGSAWMFSLIELHLPYVEFARVLKREQDQTSILNRLPSRRKKFIQLTATDITERWRLTTELEPQSEELAAHQKELRGVLKDLRRIIGEREKQNAKVRTQTALGERLSALLQVARSEQGPDHELLRRLSQEVIDDLKSVSTASMPDDELKILRQTLASVGAGPLPAGSLPDIAMQLLRELPTTDRP